LSDNNSRNKTKRSGTKTILAANHLKKSYGKHQAVADLSLAVGSGEIIGLLGPNGAGKTTSFYMIVGLIKADAGTITLDDQDLTRLPMHGRARAGIGYLPQEASVFRRLTVEQNLRAILELQNDLSRSERREREDKLLDEFGLTPIRTQRGERLSGGERRRLEIARALASDPSFMLLDEPFAGVDPISVADIKEQIRDLLPTIMCAIPSIFVTEPTSWCRDRLSRRVTPRRSSRMRRYAMCIWAINSSFNEPLG